jgi:hypothetical protein
VWIEIGLKSLAEGGKVTGAPGRVLEWGSCGQARIVGGEGRSKKLRVILEGKIIWNATAERTGQGSKEA